MPADDIDLYAASRNPDGTYNGIKFLHLLTGIPEEQIKEDWEKVKNARKDDRK